VNGFEKQQKMDFTLVLSRVARWLIFKPKIPIWVKFAGPWKGKCCHIL
jgi:hypothetical protein